MKKICIFCGSSMGFDPIYRQKATEMGLALAEKGCELLYGGGSVGLMKIIADVMMERHCKVTGTITQHLLDMRVGHPEIDELIVVETMSERKKILEDMADAFIAMPGGLGTTTTSSASSTAPPRRVSSTANTPTTSSSATTRKPCWKGLKTSNPCKLRSG